MIDKAANQFQIAVSHEGSRVEEIAQLQN